jgi:chromosome segregation protein
LKIRRLDIIGFKSFAEKLLVKFNDGVTGVVGPNGCGKSNVVDALRWVMGEQSARRLRGKSMEDLIFAGSETKPPMGMAEVLMTLENDGLNIPPEYADYNEIVVGRRLFRSGESEYSINKTPCRLLDVQELFMGTGVGTRAYSIISQGQIGLLVSQKPEERRTLIEEAAGISKYHSRKKVAMRKMEQTRQNLLRVNDVLKEITRNINSLKRQARKAARYIKIRDQLKEIELHSASHRFLELQSLYQYYSIKAELFSDKEHEILSSLSQLESSVEKRRFTLLEEDRLIGKAQEDLLSADNQIKLCEQNIEFLSREEDSLSQRGQESAQQIEELRAEYESISSKLEESKKELFNLDSSAHVANQKLLEKDDAHGQQAKLVEELMVEIDSNRQTQMNMGEKTGEMRTRLSSLEQRLVELEGRLGQSEGERTALKQQFEELSEQKRSQTDQLSKSRQLHLDLVEKREINENTYADLLSKANENEARCMALRDEVGNRRSRLKSLQEIEHNYDGCLNGVRWVMKNSDEEKEASDVIGLVADILQSPPQYETAVQAVLGERLQGIVVKSQDTSVSAIDNLKKLSEGRSSFIPLSLRESPNLEDGTNVAGPGVIGPMRNLLKFDQEHAPVVEYLLGNVVVMEDLPSAMSVWSANGHQATLVTLEGDVLEPQGVLTGGSLEGPGTHLLENKREIRELTEKVQELDAKYKMAQDQQVKLKSQIASVASTIESLRDNSHDEEIRVRDQQKDLSHLHEQVNTISLRLEELGYDCEKTNNDINTTKREIITTREGLDQLNKDQQELESSTQKAKESAEENKRILAALSQDVLELKVQAAACHERQESGRQNVTLFAQNQQEIDQRIERLRNEVTSCNTQVVTGRKQREEIKIEISTLLEQREKLQGEQQVRREGYDKLHLELQEDETRLKEVRKQQEQASKQLNQYQSQIREFELERSHLIEDVRRNYKTEIYDCISSYHLLPPPSKEQLDKVEKLRKAMERMGDVNPHAVETYEELLERHEFLATQSKDLTDSLQRLETVIQKINRVSRKRFREAFEAINIRFQEVFPRLFNGGNAVLKLEENKDLLSAGVEIVVRPPGKKLQNMELLSGGEKALTAVALLFSIFLVKPTPFCVLDEVDAPLDDANLDRFNMMIREMSKSSQFIIITHNKRTMESVDRLYGITMEEPGISRVVGVQLTDERKQAKKIA